MNLPALGDWERTSHSLHAAARLLGALRQLVREPLPNYLELALRIERDGLSTDRLSSGGTVMLEWERAALVSTSRTGDQGVIPLTGHTQATLLESLLGALDAQGDRLFERSAEHASLAQAFLAALDARGHLFKPTAGELTGSTPLAVDRPASIAYGTALYRVFTALARFRARLAGPQTPIVVWPEHFDLSTLWFATPDRGDEAPVMNFGFAPFDAVHERPYLYAYAYPMPPDFARLPLPAPARWHTEGWSGAYVSYDDLQRFDDPEAEIESLSQAIYDLLSPALLS